MRAFSTKKCLICRLYELRDLYKACKVKQRGFYDKLIVTIVTNGILPFSLTTHPVFSSKSKFCSDAHLEEARLLKKYFRQGQFSVIKARKEQLKKNTYTLEKLKQQLYYNLQHNLISDAYYVATDILHTQRVRAQRIRWLKQAELDYKNAPALCKVTSFDVFSVLQNIDPDVIKVGEEHEKRLRILLTDHALSQNFKPSDVPSLIDKLTTSALSSQEALRLINENKFDTDGFDFSDLDSEAKP